MFDLKRLEKFIISKRNGNDVSLTAEEIQFMSNIFNMIIDSEDYDSTILYLAGIYGMSISDIKFIRNIYFKSFASKKEKQIYSEKMRGIKKRNRKKGFVNLSFIIFFVVSIIFTGISLAIWIYKS